MAGKAKQLIEAAIVELHRLCGVWLQNHTGCLNLIGEFENLIKRNLLCFNNFLNLRTPFDPIPTFCPECLVLEVELIDVFDVHSGVDGSLYIASNHWHAMLKTHAFANGIAGVLIVEGNLILRRTSLKQTNRSQHHCHHDPDLQAGGRVGEGKARRLVFWHRTLAAT